MGGRIPRGDRTLERWLSLRPGDPVPEALRTPVAAIMSREVVTADPEISIQSALEQMVAAGLTRLPVVDEGGLLLGIFSQSDLLSDEPENEEVASDVGCEPPGERHSVPWVRLREWPRRVGEVMTRPALCIAERTSIAVAAAQMVRNHVHALPVVDARHCLVGIVSALDLAAWIAGMTEPALPVAEEGAEEEIGDPVSSGAFSAGALFASACPSKGRRADARSARVERARRLLRRRT